MKTNLFLFLAFFTVFCSAQKTNSVSIFYDIGKFSLTPKQQKKLDDVIKKLNPNNKYEVQIISSADYLGTNKANYILAQKRAQTIQDYLKKDTIFKVYNVINKGKIASDKKDKEGILKDRKTKILFQAMGRSIQFKKLNVGEKTVLQNLLFIPGKAILRKQSFIVLDHLVAFLKNHPTVNIDINGHVCCSAGIVKTNPKDVKPLSENHLSTRRAKLVYRYLIFKGIDKNRLKYAGYGFQTPLIYPEKNEDDMHKNKRVEIVITKT